MNEALTLRRTFDEADIKATEHILKVGLLATINEEGLPHLTLISSLQACSATQVAWGQFTEGLSKEFIRRNPLAGFMVMTLEKELWRGKATFCRSANDGPEYEAYNNTPMFRYNAYFGIHTVYYMDLVGHTGRQSLPMGRIVVGALLTMAAKSLGRKPEGATALNPWTCDLFDKMDALKFLAYVDTDGYPAIIPVIQAQAWSSGGVIFSTTAFGDELAAIPVGKPVAILGMALSMEDVLVRGPFGGLGRIGGVRCGTVQVEWVYNSMPPVPQQIYPPVALERVRDFR
jgi:hypothetical protein